MTKTDNTKAKDTISFMKGIADKFGKGKMYMDGADLEVEDPISTDIPILDKVLNIGGIPRRKITEIYGPEQGGKSTLCLHIMKNAQKLGLTAIYIDYENAFNLEYANKIGLETSGDKWLMGNPSYGEEGFEMIEESIAKWPFEIGVVCIDSLDCIVPKEELEGDFSARHVGGRARIINNGLHRLTDKLLRENIALVMTNQLRSNIVTFGHAPSKITSGGDAPKYYASVRLETRRVTKLTDSKNNIIGSSHKVKVVKSRLSKPWSEIEFEVLEDGISYEGGLIDAAIKYDIIGKSTSWLYYEDYKWQGKDAARNFLKANPELLEKIKTELYASVDNVVSVESTIDIETGEILGESEE